MAEIDGARLVARCLKQQGVDELFGVVGIPVTGIAAAAASEGIRYIGTRHEQAAGYAAQAISYLKGRIGVCLVVSGPGMTNAISALGNAWANCWPMLLIGGSSNQALNHMGDFQAAPQVDLAKPFCKWVGQAERIDLIPRYIATAVRHSISGRPGPVYLDLPGDVIASSLEEDDLSYPQRVEAPPAPQVDPASIKAAVAALKSARQPLAIIGKGAAWAGAEEQVRRFIEETQMPFLPSPMGKGVVPDGHPLSVAAARSYALQNADLVFTIGARLNWIMHFGLPPRFREDLRVVQLDVAAEEIGSSVPSEAPLVGDAKVVMAQMVAELEESPWQIAADNPWRQALDKEKAAKQEATVPMLESDEVPMNYYRPLQEIQQLLPHDAIIVTEGASTMDISRQVLDNYEPRKRLDAGTWGTMGVGPGFAIAAQVANPDKRVIALEGDAAFGFDGLEVEVAVRHKLPITWIVFNNNGIGGGPSSLPEGASYPPNAFVPNARYDKVMEAFGGKGYHAETPQELRAALQASFDSGETTLINVTINPESKRRPQQFAWLTRG
ncbi:2-hydroxyacyl-CoA lyase 1 [Geodia barretti]|uniref:2-hydroxyacyl-CoA lyase 2 n=2 Tax=Geodia barretti TaxID=519541 RepID=A0AA35RCY4_GEOBA|nr:2-hydroxyacyl-CoA lyase 1 [Geodia barretti]